MSLFKSYSGKVVVLLILIFSLTTCEKIEKVVTKERTCVCLADGFGYYMYLPYLFQNGDLNMSPEWALELQKEKCAQTYVYQLKKRDNGNYVDIYQMGMAMVMLPSYSMGELIARAGGYERDGFSTPYHVAYHVNIFLFIVLGLIYLRKLLLLFAKDIHVAIGMGILYLGSNIYVTFVHQYDLPHLFLFALNAISLYHIFKYQKSENPKSLWYAAAIFGLTVCIRPTQAILGIIPLVVLLKKHGISFTTFKYISLFPLFALLINIPQFFYWYQVGGELFTPNLHSEDIVLSDPNLIDFLFSYRKGWLLYSPIFLLIPFGFYSLYKKQKELFWAILTSVGLYIYVMSSWECWWYASSFGSRVMVDIYPLLTIVLVIFIGSLSRLLSKLIVGFFTIGCILLSLLQSKQIELGYLDTENMTKEHYWYIFGKQNINNYHKDFLLVERMDLEWIESKKDLPSDKFEIRQNEIYSLPERLVVQPGQTIQLREFVVLDEIESRETLIELKVTSKTSDSTLASIINFETFSSYNNYGWNALEVSLNQRQDKYNEHIFKFNVPWIRHREDKMNIYIFNPNKTTITIDKATITAHTLIRK